VLRHAWTGGDSCPAAEQYRAELPRRRAAEAETLSSLTGWSLGDIRRKMSLPASLPRPDLGKWWERIWKD
jgi:hypothetical protein